MFVLAAVMLEVIFPNQVTITPLKLALLPRAVPISNRVSSAVDAPLVNVLNDASTYDFIAVLAVTIAEFDPNILLYKLLTLALANV